MKPAKTIGEIRSAVGEARRRGAEKVGLVPTMGALHEGHFSLIDAARGECDFVVVSIFVNPTQFGPNEDFEQYPRSLEADLAACRARGVDAVFVPGTDEMYPRGAVTSVRVMQLTDGLCGAHRPGHFDGVCTIVAKLFNIVSPDVAYFGAKDYQQAVVVSRMVADLDLPLRVAVCPTIREADGLAMSSRNARLGDEERSQAVSLVESLRLAESLVAAGERNSAKIIEPMRRYLAEAAPLGRIDYIEIVEPDSLVGVEEIRGPVVALLAVRFPSARLIDNLRLAPRAGKHR